MKITLLIFVFFVVNMANANDLLTEDVTKSVLRECALPVSKVESKSSFCQSFTHLVKSLSPSDSDEIWQDELYMTIDTAARVFTTECKVSPRSSHRACKELEEAVLAKLNSFLKHQK